MDPGKLINNFILVHIPPLLAALGVGLSYLLWDLGTSPILGCSCTLLLWSNVVNTDTGTNRTPVRVETLPS
jgi:hypothetical protein